MTDTDTIAALATAPGIGGVGIVRVSGPDSAEIAREMLGAVPRPRYAEFREFHNQAGEVIDSGIALFFPGPRSFTGEDVLELHGHGGPVVLDRVFKSLLAAGARPARPGEFSERAFLNDKIDLIQAEAIADLIEAGSEEAARAALHSLQGVFSNRVHMLVEELIALRTFVEAAIDFPEEEIDFIAQGQVLEKTEALVASLNQVFESARQGCLQREGMFVVLAGQPNVGKSSLLNRLAGRETAIVTEIPGTTRDVLREEINLDGLPVHIVDTAGLREAGDAIEEEGMRRAWQEIERANRVLLIVDDTAGMQPADQDIVAKLPPGLPVTVVYNKVDLSDRPGSALVGESDSLFTSATTGAGIAELSEFLKRCVGYRTIGVGGFSARRRHLDALQRARQFLMAGCQVLSEHGAGELLAEDLRQAQQVLGEITGEFNSEDLLGKIFSSFCIGK